MFMVLSKNGFKKPIIGCTTYTYNIGESPAAFEMMGLNSDYLRAISAAGGLPVLIPNILPDDEIMDLFTQIDGLLLPGGGDVDPVHYGAGDHPALRGIDPNRDRVELMLARRAVEEKKPFLAICRGVQVLNVAMGGTLWQDVASQRPSSIRHDYYLEFPRGHIAHPVQIDPHSLLARQLDTAQIDVNSMHHQGLRDLGAALKLTAQAEDGMIEGVEAVDHPYGIGVQWHPENLVEEHAPMRGLFTGLVQAANGH
jgi:putative glutamine amidotransferase